MIDYDEPRKRKRSPVSKPQGPNRSAGPSVWARVKRNTATPRCRAIVVAAGNSYRCYKKDHGDGLCHNHIRLRQEGREFGRVAS